MRRRIIFNIDYFLVQEKSFESQTNYKENDFAFHHSKNVHSYRLTIRKSHRGRKILTAKTKSI